MSDKRFSTLVSRPRELSPARKIWQLRLLLLLALAAAVGLTTVTAISAQQAKGPAPAGAPKDVQFDKALEQDPEGFEVLATDGSRVRVRLLDEEVPLKTPFGTLSIPAGDIVSIDFASRVPDGVAQRVTDAIAKLGDDEFKSREAAGAELLSLGALAYAPLTAAAKSEDAEVAWRAEQLLERIQQTVDEQLLFNREEDSIVTAKSQITGNIELDTLRVDTAVFGEQEIKLALLRRLSLGQETNAALGPVAPDPGTLHKYQNQLGQTMLFRVTGSGPGKPRGALWGTNVYTLDSSLAMAAVHSGALAPGETGVVSVTIMGPQNRFVGSQNNGIVSADWGQYPGSFVVKPVAAGARNQNIRWNLPGR